MNPELKDAISIIWNALDAIAGTSDATERARHIDNARDQLVRISSGQWISVKERLPEERIRVLTKDNLGLVCILYYGLGNYGPEGEEVTWRDTHTDLPWGNHARTVRLEPIGWMPLPD